MVPVLHLNYASLLILLFNFTITQISSRGETSQRCFIHKIKKKNPMNFQNSFYFPVKHYVLAFHVCKISYKNEVFLLFSFHSFIKFYNCRFLQEPKPITYSFTNEPKKTSSNRQIFIFLFYESLLFDFFFLSPLFCGIKCIFLGKKSYQSTMALDICIAISHSQLDRTDKIITFLLLPFPRKFLQEMNFPDYYDRWKYEVLHLLDKSIEIGRKSCQSSW